MANRYWVGGSGNFNDTAHWSASSGGASGASAPTSVDDAFFDANSFSADGQYVQMYNAAYGTVRNLDFSAVDQAIQPRGSVKIYGNLALSSLLDTQSYYPFFWFVGTGAMTVTSNGCNIYGDLQLGGDGVTNFSGSSLTMLDNLTFPEGSNGVYMAAGAFDANNFNYTAPTFYAEAFDGYDIPIYMGTGTWTIYDTWTVYEDDPIYAGGVVTVVKETSTLRFTSPTLETSLHLKINLFQANVDFHNVVVDNMGNNYFWIGESFINPFYATPSFIPTFNFNDFTMTRKANNTDWVYLYSTAATTYTFSTFTVTGYDTSDLGNIGLYTIDQIGTVIYSTFNIGIADTSKILVSDNYAIGTAAPITPVGGRDGGGTSGWFFPIVYVNEFENVSVTTDNQWTSWIGIAGGTINRMGWSGETVDRAEALQVVPTANRETDRILIRLGTAAGPTDNLVLSIYQGGTNPENGSLIDLFVVAGSSIPNAFSYDTMTQVAFVFSDRVTFLSGVTYWFTITRSGPAASQYYYYSPNFANADATAVRWTKNSAGTWTVNASGREFEFYGQIVDPLVILELSGSSGALTKQKHDFVLVTESVTIVPSPPDLPFSKSETVTITEFRDIVVDNTRHISVSDSITVTDVIPSRLKIRKPSPIGNERYWVSGGSGDWSDGNLNWSDVSGGTPGVDPPDGFLDSPFGYANQANNNVYFDANSFVGDGNVINMDISGVSAPNTQGYCKGIDMSGLTKTVTFSGVGSLKSVNPTNGTTVVLSNKATISVPFELTKGTGTISFDQAGATITNTMNFGGHSNQTSAPTYNLISALNSSSSMTFFGAFPSLIFSATKTTINTNNHNITCTSISGGASGDALSGGQLEFNAGTSTINCTSWSFAGSASVSIGISVWYFGTNSIINITPTGANASINVTLSGIGGSHAFGTINIFKGVTGHVTKFLSNGGPGWALSGNLTIQAGSEVHMQGYGSGVAVVAVAGTFIANGAPGNLIRFDGNGSGTGVLPADTQGNITAAVANVSYVNVDHSLAGGAGSPFNNSIGGVNSGFNTNWTFPTYIDVFDSITVLTSFSKYRRSKLGIILQSGVPITNGVLYKLTFDSTGMLSSGSPATITVRQGTQTIYTFTTAVAGSHSVTFTANGTGGSISFDPDMYVIDEVLDNVVLKQVFAPGVDDNIPVKAFLEGETDEGREITFRVDTQPIQFQSSFELSSTPISVITRLQRGTMAKCFVSLDDGEWYQIEGTIQKGVSILKVHSNSRGEIPSPPVARKIQLSWRDGSKQLCRLIQSAVIFVPGTMEPTE